MSGRLCECGAITGTRCVEVPASDLVVIDWTPSYLRESHRCGEIATTRDECGTDVCVACADYYLDADDDPVCSRMQGYATCRHCGTAIDWGMIQTRQGASNWREGHCDCRGWTDTEMGSDWRLSEGRAEVAS